MNKKDTIKFYKNHKYRSCNGFFDAKVRGSVNRSLVKSLKESFHVTDDELKLIDEEIDRKLGRV